MSDPGKNRERGDIGEDAAVQFLIDHRCEICVRNFISYGGGEIDIIAENEARILFVEVKSRKISPGQFRYGRPSAAVTWDKQKRIIAAARAYLTAHPTDKAIRFDVAEVFLTQSDPPAVLDINYIKGAFIKQKGRNSYD